MAARFAERRGCGDRNNFQYKQLPLAVLKFHDLLPRTQSFYVQTIAFRLLDFLEPSTSANTTAVLGPMHRRFGFFALAWNQEAPRPLA